MRSRSARLAACLTGLVLPFALVSPAHAAPDRALGTGWFYVHAGYGTPSAQFGAANAGCVNLPPDWQRKISSFTARAQVILYSQPNCWQDGPWQTYLRDTSYVGDTMNDKAISVRVW
jgi:hypothetical protein